MTLLHIFKVLQKYRCDGYECTIRCKNILELWLLKMLNSFEPTLLHYLLQRIANSFMLHVPQIKDSVLHSCMIPQACLKVVEIIQDSFEVAFIHSAQHSRIFAKIAFFFPQSNL